MIEASRELRNYFCGIYERNKVDAAGRKAKKMVG